MNPKFILTFIFSLSLLSSCDSILKRELEEDMPDTRTLFLESECPFDSSLGVVYGNDLGKKELESVEKILKIVLGDICLGSFPNLLSLVDGETGLYVDAKGHFTKEEVKTDLENKEGYFAVYYFNPEALARKKGNTTNLTVRQILVSAKKIEYDLYISSKEEVEVRFRFLENEKNARLLINPGFIKKGGRWYLLRTL